MTTDHDAPAVNQTPLSSLLPSLSLFMFPSLLSSPLLIPLLLSFLPLSPPLFFFLSSPPTELRAQADVLLSSMVDQDVL